MSRTETAYRALIDAGELKADPDQAAAAAALGRLECALETRPAMLARLFGTAPPAPRGIYVWGGVGRGKSMLMDLFFGHSRASPKRRVHFHEFMLEAHRRLHARRQHEAADPISEVARALATEARLLAFDEMQVTNVVDAMILSRLFTALLDAGVTVVATSNRPPAELYKDGLNRELFVPFIELIEARLEIVGLNGPTDYRLDRLAGMPTYYVPNGAAATEALREAFFRLTDYPPEDRANVPTEALPVPGGRSLHVPKSLKGVAVFSFKRLCEEARGAADYIAIAQRFHTVILVGVPAMGPDRRNEAARFATLIDTLYEYRVKLLVAAAAAPVGLYRHGDGSFEFERTASRLVAMQSAGYLAQGHGAGEH